MYPTLVLYDPGTLFMSVVMSSVTTGVPDTTGIAVLGRSIDCADLWSSSVAHHVGCGSVSPASLAATGLLAGSGSRPPTAPHGSDRAVIAFLIAVSRW